MKEQDRKGYNEVQDVSKSRGMDSIFISEMGIQSSGAPTVELEVEKPDQ